MKRLLYTSLIAAGLLTTTGLAFASTSDNISELIYTNSSSESLTLESPVSLFNQSMQTNLLRTNNETILGVGTLWDVQNITTVIYLAPNKDALMMHLMPDPSGDGNYALWVGTGTMTKKTQLPLFYPIPGVPTVGNACQTDTSEPYLIIFEDVANASGQPLCTPSIYLTPNGIPGNNA